MKIIGIIAEYNPFHHGHAYQIKKIKETTGADYVVIAMSGDFVQRGTPAVIDKYARTQMALSCGADLVVELPALWATASAESFAMAGVTLFDKMGCVDGLCFGAETENLELLSAIADILAEEPEAFSALLSAHLKNGLSFPAARARALLTYMERTGSLTAAKEPDASGAARPAKDCFSMEASHLEKIVSTPNNILAIEYLKALKKRNSKIKPFLIKREGAGYHDTVIASADGAPNASATAIRELLPFFQPGHPRSIAPVSNEGNFPAFQSHASQPGEAAAVLQKVMPSAAFAVLQDYLAENPILFEDDFSSIVNYLLLFYAQQNPAAGKTGALALFGDSSRDIANRMIKNSALFRTFSQFCECSKSKDITYTRMSRILVHILLNITNHDYELGKSLDYIPYFRLLGFKKASSGILTEIKQSSEVPMLSKLADAADVLNSDALWLLEKDIFSADLYERTLCRKKQEALSAAAFSGFSKNEKKTTPRSEYSRGIVLFSD